MINVKTSNPPHGFRYLLPLLLWVAIMLTASSIPSTRFPLKGVNDKILHFAEYFILALLAFVAFSRARQPFFRRAFFVVSIVFCFLFGIFDELYQSFIPTRVTDFADFASDMVGVAAASLVVLIRRAFQKG